MTGSTRPRPRLQFNPDPSPDKSPENKELAIIFV